ncbi:MAG TPA: hypothetical protein VF025_12830, partial [Gaiellaceae bacterium]
RRARISARGVRLFILALMLNFTAVEIVGWIRRHDQLGGVAALLVYLTSRRGWSKITPTHTAHSVSRPRCSSGLSSSAG